jgi:hypothetical protein
MVCGSPLVCAPKGCAKTYLVLLGKQPLAASTSTAEKNQRKPTSAFLLTFSSEMTSIFRFALPIPLKERMGNEVCLSLRTPFRSEALKLSQRIHSWLLELSTKPGMDFTELRRALYFRLQAKLDENSVNPEPRRPSNIYEGIEKNIQSAIMRIRANLSLGN